MQLYSKKLALCMPLNQFWHVVRFVEMKMLLTRSLLSLLLLWDESQNEDDAHKGCHPSQQQGALTPAKHQKNILIKIFFFFFFFFIFLNTKLTPSMPV